MTPTAVWIWWLRWVGLHIEDKSQVELQFDVIGKSALTSLGAGVLLFAYEAVRSPPKVALVWLVGLLCLVVPWLLLRSAFRQRSLGARALAHWAALNALNVFGMGFIWGLCIWVFDVPQNFNGSIAVVTTQTAVAMTGWLFFSGFFPSLLMYSLGLFVPAAMAYAWQGDFAHAALCLALHIVFVMQARKVIEVIRIRHEKESLVLQLQHENDARQVALAAAHEATAAKTRFFAAVSHDVRQPLYSLSLLAGTTTQLMAETQRRDVQQRMQQSVAALDGLFTQLLEVSQLDAGALKPKMEPVDLAAFMRDTARLFEAQLHAGASTLSVNTIDVFVLADRAWLQRIVLNLLGNALNYADGSKLEFFARQQDRGVVLGVQDSGPGIAENMHEKIFEEFYRASDQLGGLRGFGLGLPIVRRLARAMGSDVYVKSTLGKGSTFWLELEALLATSSLLPHQPDTPVKPDLPVASLLQGAVIGVVEDDENIGHALCALLRSWGLRIIWARGSQEALQWAVPTDALIVDYQLAPDDALSGVDVALALRSRWASAQNGSPAVLIASSLNLDAIETAGFDALVKPLAPARLRAWLLKVVTSRLKVF